MNQLVKELIRPLLENSQKVTAVFGGGFKPPIKGHFNIVKQALKDFPEVDDFIIYVGGGVRDGITQEQSMAIWDVYQEVLGSKVQVAPSAQPIRDVIRYAKDHPDELVYFVIGARQGRQDDLQDVASRTKGVEEKYPNHLKVSNYPFEFELNFGQCCSEIGKAELYTGIITSSCYPRNPILTGYCVYKFPTNKSGSQESLSSAIRAIHVL